jgi:hypothetical protein
MRQMSAGPEKIVFVGGAPRSGTTVTHALISTSEKVSEYRPEISFFRSLPIAYRNGRVAWPQHTSAFFEDQEAFRAVIRQSADVSLLHIWRTLDSQPILAVKDPLLTPLFPDLHELYPDIGWFVTVIRNPYDVVRSRQEVHDQSGTGRPFTVQDAGEVAREYMSYYRAVLNTNFGGRHFAFRYEDINSERLQNALAQFVGVNAFHVRPMWGKPRDLSGDPWNSPKYHQPIDLEPRLPPLAPELRQTVDSICAQMIERFGYS